MEYIEGRDLQYYLDRKYSFPEEVIRRWLLQLSEVLEYLHSQQPPILHSDIKPGNIMITDSGDVCLIDFNISLDGETSKDVQGISPWYAAPEQYERAQHILDGRMDIYSLGATFYCLMTGLLPSPVDDQSEQLRYMDIPYSDGLKAIVCKMLKRRPSGRYASAEKLRASLEDIGKMDPVYRRYGYLQISILFAWLLCVIAGSLCIYYGNWQNTVEKWQQAYQSLYISAENQNETEVVAKGTDILNSFTYRSYLDKNTEKKAEVLNILGESYFRQERFGEAADYYKEAWDLNEASGNFCENYIVALIRDGQTEKARQAVQLLEARKALSPEEQNLLVAEIAWADGEKESVQGELEAIAEEAIQTGDMELACDAYLLLSDIYLENQAYSDAVAVLEKAVKMKDDKDVRRRLGKSAYLAATESEREINGNAYLTKAYESYEWLNQSSHPGYEDRLNLALVERAMGKYERSNLTLKEMLTEYPDKYEVSMWMCYNYLDLAKEQKSYADVGNDLKFRYESGKHLYDSQGASDTHMEQLKEIMNELEG